MTTSDSVNDPILQMLDSLEDAIKQDPNLHLPDNHPTDPVVRASPSRPPPARAVGSVEPLARELSLRSYPDPAPRSAGVGARVQGSTSRVLSQFKWGS